MIRVVTRGEPMVRVLVKRARRAWCPTLFPCPFCGTRTLRIRRLRNGWSYVHDCHGGFVFAGFFATWDGLRRSWNRNVRAESRILRKERKEGGSEC